MMDFFLEYALNNLILSLALALLASLVHRHGKLPHLTQFLWLLVLLKILLPPLVTVPVFTIPTSSMETMDHQFPEPLAPPTPIVLGEVDLHQEPAFEESVVAPEPKEAPLFDIEQLKMGLGLLWALGSVMVFVISFSRMRRFDSALKSSAQPAPVETQSLAAGLARKLGLSRSPTVYLGTAKISPMLWWIGGQARIYVPKDYFRESDQSELRWVLAHELGHFSRGDHLVRCLEWLTCVIFWWNPVAWLARRQLRINEEVCCDLLVISTLNAPPKAYAQSLLTVIEFLAGSTLRPPAMASGINSGGNLERRFRMIVSNKPKPRRPRWLSSLAVFCGLAFLPFGVAQAQSPDYEAVGTRLLRAVERGELSAAQAKAMMGELARARFAERLQALAQKHHSGKNASKARRPGKAPSWERIMEGYKKLGVEVKTVKKVAEVLLKEKISKEKLPRVLGLMARYLHSVKSGSPLNSDRYSRALKEMGLNKEQSNRVWSLTKRLAYSVKSAKNNQGRQKREKTRPSKLENLKREYAQIEKKIWRAVKLGQLSEKDAKRKLEVVKKKMFGGRDWSQKGRSGGERGELEQMKRKYLEVEKELWRMVKAGKLSERDAKRKLEALKKRMFPKYYSEKRKESRERRPQPSMEARKDRFEAAKKRLIEAVKAGKLSRAEAGEKLAKLRAQLFGNEGSKPQRPNVQRQALEEYQKRRMEAKVKKYRALMKRYENAVKEGKMKAEDARRRMLELRKEMFGDQARPGRDRSRARADEKKQVWKALRQAVENGRLTEKQAKERWNGYLKKLKERGREKKREKRRGEKKRQVV